MKYLDFFRETALVALCAIGILVFGCGKDEVRCPPCPDCPRDSLEAPDVAVNSNKYPSFLVVSDVHLNAEKATIDYVECTESWGSKSKGYSDTGTDLWGKAKTKINSLIDQSVTNRPQFIVYLGDLPAHDECVNDPNNHDKDIGKVLADLRQLATDNCLPLVYVPGNNDGLAGDYASFENGKGQRPFYEDKGFANKWPLIVPIPSQCQGTPATPELIDTTQLDMGYYSAYPLGSSTQLRTISLNTVIFTNKSYGGQHGSDQLQAAKDELNWLRGQLSDACVKGDAVYLLMHIPPGNDYKNHPDWFTSDMDGRTALQVFLDVVDSADCIKGVFYSHTHMDEIKLLQNSKNKFTQLGISCPGITPQHGNNAGFKTVSFDPKSFALMDFTTHWSDFWHTHSEQPFSNQYSFSQYYQKKESSVPMAHFIDSLNTAGATQSIVQGMRNTYKVRNGTGFGNKTEQAIWVSY